MYSVVLMMALTSGAENPTFMFGHGCRGSSCHGSSGASCNGGSCSGSSCHGGRGGLFHRHRHSCNGCSGSSGCSGYSGCTGSTADCSNCSTCTGGEAGTGPVTGTGPEAVKPMPESKGWNAADITALKATLKALELSDADVAQLSKSAKAAELSANELNDFAKETVQQDLKQKGKEAKKTLDDYIAKLKKAVDKANQK